MDHLEINHRKIPFEHRRSKRAKYLKLKIEVMEPKVVLVTPKLTLNFQVNRFLKKHADWIEEKWIKLETQLKKRPKLEHSIEYYKAKAKKIIRERLRHFNAHYQFEYNRVNFRNQKTRWGSCSSQKNLSFNWRLILAPPEILDYVVVHELCHLKEMNHSKAFWKLVETQVPDHKKKRKWLKENHCLLTIS